MSWSLPWEPEPREPEPDPMDDPFYGYNPDDEMDDEIGRQCRWCRQTITFDNYDERCPDEPDNNSHRP